MSYLLSHAMTEYRSQRQAKNFAIGAQFEQVVRQKLESLGYAVDTIADWSGEYDLLCDGIPVEVKGANRKAYKVSKGRQPREGWAFECARISNDINSIVIFVARAEIDYFYIVPIEVVLSWPKSSRNSFRITTHPTKFTGRLSQWLDRWDVITQVKDKLDVSTN